MYDVDRDYIGDAYEDAMANGYDLFEGYDSDSEYFGEMYEDALEDNDSYSQYDDNDATGW